VPADVAADLVWLFRRDTFAAFTAGDLIGVTVRAEGFEVTAATPTPPPDDLAERLTAAIADEAEDELAFLDSVMWALCADDPGLFTKPLPPLTELLDELGFASDGNEVAPPGVDLDDRRAGRKVERIQRTYDLDADAALVVLVFQQLHESATALLDLAADMSDASELSDLAAAEPFGAEAGVVAESDDTVGVTDAIEDSLPFQADPAVAEAVDVETMGAGTDGAAALGMLAETFEARSPRSARPALRWLRGKALDRLGRVLEAEQAYAGALALDPDWMPGLFDLARIASDRGDADRGLSLLNRAGADPDDNLVRLLQHFRPVERTDIGRNQPCWCGSGRKYKQCHRNREQLPLDERAAWLYQKAGMYVSDGPSRAEVLELASIRSRSGTTSLWQAINDPTVADVVLFEGGAFEAFLEERGPLLPDDERLLGEQWLLAEGSLAEIARITPGSGFRARALRTGARVNVRERRGSTAVREHMLVCARFVPAGDTVQCFGGMEPVELHQRDGMLALLDSEPEPEALLEALSARFAPPQLENTEGDPLVQCEATRRSVAPAGLAVAQVETDEGGGADRRWHE
jgi:tetratricopeptide (TPR) repeat protein